MGDDNSNGVECVWFLIQTSDVSRPLNHLVAALDQHRGRTRDLNRPPHKSPSGVRTGQAFAMEDGSRCECGAGHRASAQAFNYFTISCCRNANIHSRTVLIEQAMPTQEAVHVVVSTIASSVKPDASLRFLRLIIRWCGGAAR